MNRHRSLFIFATFIGLAVCTLAIAMLPEGRNTLTIALVIVMGATCFSSILYDSMRGRLDRFEIVHLFLILWFIYFGLSSLYLLYDRRIAYDSRVFPWLDRSLLLCLGAAVSFLYGYFLSRRIRRAPERSREIRGTLWIGVVYLIGMAGGVGTMLADRQMHASSRVSGIVSLLEPFEFLTNFGFFLLVYQWFRGKATLSQKTLLISLVVPCEAVLLFIRLGGKFYALTILGMPLVALAYARRRLPSKSLVAILLFAVFVVFPLYGTFRMTSRNSSFGTRISKSVDSLAGFTPQSYTENSVFIVANRMALINSVAIILAETGRSVDYQYGRTIGEVFVALAIPRIFWPDKPSLGIGRDFGRQFRILPRWDMSTYVAITPVGELYWNFGVAGVISGMFLLGIGLQRIYAALGQSGASDPLRLAMYAGILPILMNYEGGVSAWSVLVLRALAFYLVLGWVLRRGGGSVPVVSDVAEADLLTASGTAELAPG